MADIKIRAKSTHDQFKFLSQNILYGPRIRPMIQSAGFVMSPINLKSKGLRDLKKNKNAQLLIDIGSHYLSCPEKDENEPERRLERNLKINEDKQMKQKNLDEYNNLSININNEISEEKIYVKEQGPIKEELSSITIKLLKGEGCSDLTAELNLRSSYDCMDLKIKHKLSSEMELNSAYGLNASRKNERIAKLSQTQKIPNKQPKKNFNENFILEEDDDEYEQACFKNQANPGLIIQRTSTTKLDVRNRSLSSILTKLYGRGKIEEVESD